MRVYNITPVPKPRQTRADKWQQRPCVMRYRAFADQCVLHKVKFQNGDSINFILPMPDSWPEKKKKEMENKPHQQTPDLDNMIKAIFDALFHDDCKICDIGRITKRWGRTGQIEIW